MTIKEQIKRIVKAAPHLPVQAWTGAAILFIWIPVLLTQMFDEGLIQWVEAKGVVADHQGVHERHRDGEPEYFYYIAYEFSVEGKEFRAFFEEGYKTKSWAESELESRLAETTPVTLWYEASDPANATFEKEAPTWPAYLGMLVLSVLILAYFRWLLLKYYALELTREGERV